MLKNNIYSKEELTMQLSNNFTLSELTKSQTALRRGIDNTPTDEHIANLEALCQHILQPVRNYFAKPVTVNSGYRGPALNEAIGGASSSQHCKGQAADIEIPGISNYELANHISQHLEYDQLILEFYTPGDPNSGWVHVSYNVDGNRKENLTAMKEDGKTVYKAGLIE